MNTSSPTVPAYLSIAEAARLLRRKPWPIFEAIHEGELRASQPGGAGPWLIQPADLEAYVQRFELSATGGTLGERLARATR